jgi:hypothetical protein
MARLMFTVLVCGGVLLGVRARARAGDDAPPGILTLECAAPAELPARSGATLRLRCRIGGQGDFTTTVLAVVDLRGGPAFWQTLNPFPSRDELRDPFGPIRARYVDPFENGRYARPRTAGELRDPFEVVVPAPPDADVTDEP